MSAAVRSSTNTKEARAARAARARQAGNERAKANATKTVLPDTPERQAAAALAKVKAAEAKRDKPVAKAGPAHPPKLTRGSAERRPMTAPNSVSIETAIQSMNIDHVHCRDYGHSWRPYNARWLAAEHCYEQTFRCQRCTTIRTRYLSRTGSMISAQYDYVDGYRVNGLGHLSGTDRDVIRLASVRSVLVVDNADEAAG